MEKDSVYQLIKYVTDQLDERQLYFIVPAFNDDSIAFEILWKKDRKLPWSFTLYRTDNWTECSQLDILDALGEVECDLVEFQRQITDKILTQVAYMDMRIKEARKLVGSEAVDAGIEAHEEFGKQLVATIQSVLDKKSKSKLSLVKD